MSAAQYWTPELAAALTQDEWHVFDQTQKRGTALGPLDTEQLFLTIAKLRTDLRRWQAASAVLQSACETAVEDMTINRSHVHHEEAVTKLQAALATAKGGAP